MEPDTHAVALMHVVALLGAGIVAVPIFRRLGLGSVLGYFTAGLLVGPYGLRIETHPQSILHVAEFGVIMLLFLIGLEMHPTRLWQARRQIFGLGVAQVLVCGALLTAAGTLLGLPLAVSFVAAMGFVMTSTAIVTQTLEERGETSTGQRAIAILLLEDLAIVPLLAVVAFLAPSYVHSDAATRSADVLVAVGAVAGLVVIGRWVLNPMFRLLAAANAREVMTGAALLVVLGSALLMELGGLSMAMGAFIAGVLLSESTFRHQLEADIEPFRGLLLGLFFLAIGMSIDLPLIAAHWPTILGFVAAFMLADAAGIYGVARLFGDSHRESVTRAAMFTQGGEFAFVLFTTAFAEGLFSAQQNAIFTATVILSMALAPINAKLAARLLPKEKPSLDGIERPDGLEGRVLMIGFGRFGQMACQALLARGFDIAIIESDVAMIRTASEFGFKVYYGDGTRLDVLLASGARGAEAILVCVDKRETADKIVALAQSEFPLTHLFVRAYDRGHAMDLIRLGVDYQIRETMESALKFSAAALRTLGVPSDEIAELMEDTRKRDTERLQLQVAGDIRSGADLMLSNAAPQPTPFTRPRRSGVVYNSEEGGAPFTPLPQARKPRA